MILSVNKQGYEFKAEINKFTDMVSSSVEAWKFCSFQSHRVLKSLSDSGSILLDND